MSTLGAFSHGDRNGYRKHLRRGEQPCDECLAAHSKYYRDYRDSPQSRGPRRDVGQVSAAVEQLLADRQRTPDEIAAQFGWNSGAAMRAWLKMHGRADLSQQLLQPRKLKPIKHGTRAGYVLHHYRGEEACDECLAANAAHARAYYRAQRKETP